MALCAVKENILAANPMQRALKSSFSNFVIQNDQIFFKKLVKGEILYLLVLPENLVDQILYLGHNSKFSGHLGIKKTAKRILNRFYRPGLKAQIFKHVKECDSCQKIKTTQPTRKGELLFLQPERFNQIVTMDIAGPFPRSKNGNLYILIFVCAFTKFARALAIPQTNAEIIAELMIKEWISLFSIPEFILSDRGKNFLSMLLELLYEKLDIKQLRTTAYHPECDGQSERFIRTLKSMIKSYVDENQSDWDENLNELAFAYNSSVHASTGYTPYELVFGVQPRIPLDLILDVPYANNELIDEDFSNLYLEKLFDQEDQLNPKLSTHVIEYCTKKAETLKNMYSKVVANRNLVMDKAKIRHDRNIRKFSYEVGDLVLTDHVKIKKGLSSGLAHKYHGPFVIVAKHPNNVNYVIRRHNTKKSKTFLIHKNRLKKYFGHFNEAQINVNTDSSVLESSQNAGQIQSTPNEFQNSAVVASQLPQEIRTEDNSSQPNDGTTQSQNTSGELEDFSFRPYYVKKTNRARKTMPVRPATQVERRSNRERRPPDRYQA
jgi:hypothetical protein